MNTYKSRLAEPLRELLERWDLDIIWRRGRCELWSASIRGFTSAYLLMGVRDEFDAAERAIWLLRSEKYRAELDLILNANRT